MIWMHDDIKFLLHVYEEASITGRLDGTRRNNSVYREIKERFKKERNMEVQTMQIINKLKNLKREYFRVKKSEKPTKPGLTVIRTYMPFYDEIDHIITATNNCNQQNHVLIDKNATEFIGMEGEDDLAEDEDITNENGCEMDLKMENLDEESDVILIEPTKNNTSLSSDYRIETSSVSGPSNQSTNSVSASPMPPDKHSAIPPNSMALSANPHSNPVNPMIFPSNPMPSALPPSSMPSSTIPLPVPTNSMPLLANPRSLTVNSRPHPTKLSTIPCNPITFPVNPMPLSSNLPTSPCNSSTLHANRWLEEEKSETHTQKHNYEEFDEPQLPARKKAKTSSEIQETINEIYAKLEMRDRSYEERFMAFEERLLRHQQQMYQQNMEWYERMMDRQHQQLMQILQIVIQPQRPSPYNPQNSTTIQDSVCRAPNIPSSIQFPSSTNFGMIAQNNIPLQNGVAPIIGTAPQNNVSSQNGVGMAPQNNVPSQNVGTPHFGLTPQISVSSQVATQPSVPAKTS